MNYIIHTRFKGRVISGEVNLPAMTEVQVEGNVVYYNDIPLCALSSDNGNKHFARNDDNNGVERGKLTRSIQNALSKRDDNYQARWDKVWADPVCQPYKRADHADYWLWNRAFYDAPIEDLRHIEKLVKGGV